MSILAFNVSNPGFFLAGIPTSQEAAVLTNLTGLAYEQGDILYYDGTNLNRLPIGADTEVLTLVSGLPSWEPVAGGSGSGDFLANGTVPMTGDLNLNGNDLINTDSIFFDTTPATPLSTIGQVRWNSDEDTLDIQGTGITYQIGQEISPLYKNQTGSTITDGTPVMFAGAVGASGRIKIQPAIADGSIPAEYIIGITTQSIANGADGHATWFGKVRGIDTTGTPYGETWVDGDLIYVSPTTAGALTKIKPQAPDYEILVAAVAYSHSTMGTLMVRPTFNNKLTNLADVNGTPLTTTGQIPVWNNTTGYFDFTSNVTNFVTKVGTPVDNQVGVWTGDGTLEGTSGLVYYNNNLGIGESTPGTRLVVKGAANLYNPSDTVWDLNINDQLATVQTNTSFFGSEAGLVFANNNGKMGGVFGKFWGSSGYDDGRLGFVTSNAGVLSTKMIITGAGFVGIAQDTPSERLHVVGNIQANGKLISALSEPYTNEDGAISIRGTTNSLKRLNLGYDESGDYGWIQSLRKGITTNDVRVHALALTPITNNSLPLGKAGLSWSDLFLASGGVINWDSSNATLTHSTGLLTSNVDVVVPTEAYGVGWNGSNEVPTKDALYDKIETIVGGGGLPEADVRRLIRLYSSAY